MKLKLVLALAVLSASAMAQSTHSVTLSWTPSSDGGTVNVYRAPAACSTNPNNFAVIKSGVAAAGPYQDAEIAVGNYCYRLTAVVGGAESVPSNSVTAAVLPQSPTNVVITTVQ